MGGAILDSILAAEVVKPEQIYLLERNPETQQKWRDRGVNIGNPDDCDVVLLAVKPQQVEAILPLKTADNAILISILAGVNIAKLQKLSGLEKVCRTMPNLPIQVGAGMTALCFSSAVSAEEQFVCEALFAAGGKTITVEDENSMHAVTAISGSGPAYFFYLAELLQQAGVKHGLSEKQAQILAEQTLIGTGRLLEENEQSASEWRQAVTSPNGTTAAALIQFDDDNLPAVVEAAVKAAANRSLELAA